MLKLPDGTMQHDTIRIATQPRNCKALSRACFHRTCCLRYNLRADLRFEPIFMSDLIAHLRAQPYFGGCLQSTLDLLVAQALKCHFETGEAIFH